MAKTKKTTSKPKSIKVDDSAGADAVNDVAHPDTTAPSDTSKPIITHRPMMKDPMVVEENDDEKAEPAAEEKPLSRKAGGLKIVPAESNHDDEPPATDESADEVKEPEAEEPIQPAADTDTSTDDDAPTEEKPDVSAGKKSAKQDQAAENAAKAAEDVKLQKLIESEKYFLPINQVEQRRSKRFVALGIFVALLLGVVWVNIALDAGLIQIGDIKPVTHFFSN